MKLLSTKSTIRYLPPKGTAGLARSLVSGKRRVPLPPARMIPRTRSLMAIAPQDWWIRCATDHNTGFRAARLLPRRTPVTMMAGVRKNARHRARPGKECHEDPSALRGRERRVALGGRRGGVHGGDPRRPPVGASAGHGNHLSRGAARLRPRLASAPRGGSTSSTSTPASRSPRATARSRRIGAGEIVLVEDTWGKGHLSKAIDDKVRHCIFVPVD